MPFIKGQSGNPNGRPPGSQDVVTKEIKERFKDFVDGNFDKVQGWLDRVAADDPDKALSLYLQFSERILGRVTTSSIDLTSNGKELKAPIIYAIGDPPAGDQV